MNVLHPEYDKIIHFNVQRNINKNYFSWFILMQDSVEI